MIECVSIERKYTECLGRQKEETIGKERNHLHNETRNGDWLTDMPNCLNRMEFSWEEFINNLYD